MAQRAALTEGFRPCGWCLCLFLQLSAENAQLLITIFLAVFSFFEIRSASFIESITAFC